SAPARPGCAPRRLAEETTHDRAFRDSQAVPPAGPPEHPRPRPRPWLEAQEGRLVPAVQLLYGGPGSVPSLDELVSGATPFVTISEPAPNQLRIDLGAETFDATSTAQASGLIYENAGSPGAPHIALVDISQANNISTLQANLPGEALTLGLIAD